jgi:thiosulfate/3-mercaptopyruvate sulfurtransferase
VNTFKSLLLSLFVLLLGSGPAFAALEDYFVSTDWLVKNRDQVVVVDVRKAALYYLGHVDGAHLVEREQFLSKRSGVKSLVPTVAEISALLGEFGISEETTVIAYAEDDNPYAARFIWTLRYHGHEKAFVLDGGYQKWNKENHPTAVLPTAAPLAVTYKINSKPGEKHLNLRAEGDYVLTRLANPAVVVWDTRRSSEYDGSEVRADRGGHIPGATHLNWTNLQKEVNGVKVLKSEQEIRTLLAERGITSEKEIIAHCQTGIRSSYATLVLLGLGYVQVKNYDGSWIEWANNTALPIEVLYAGTDHSIRLSQNK